MRTRGQSCASGAPATGAGVDRLDGLLVAGAGGVKGIRPCAGMVGAAEAVGVGGKYC